jgi:2-polyprenyl-3-methyl-5-hydroxy-6-metoxy-1,4-benzoquinol methylase
MQARHMLICPVCGSAEWGIRYKIGEWDIGECSSCGFARIDPLPLKEARAEQYSEGIVCERNIRKRSVLRNLAKNVKYFFRNLTSRDKSGIFYTKLCKCLSPKARILDIGCGDGTFLDLAKKRFVCTGIELSDFLVSHARKKENIEIIEGDFQEADFKGNRYDGLTMIALLEHLDKPSEAAKKCFDLLNKNGILFLKTVNYGSFNRIIAKTGWAGFRPPDHIVYFNPSNLRLLLSKVGFSKIKIHSLPFSDNMYCEAWR